MIPKYWNKFDFNIDQYKAFEPDFIPIAERKSDEQRKLGTSGHLWKPSEAICWTYATDLLH